MKHGFNPFNCKILRKFDPKYKLDYFESLHNAKSEKKRRVKILKKGNRACLLLAKKLRKCKKKRRCLSNVCPVCKRQFRRWFTIKACSLFEKYNCQFVTIIPASRQLHQGNLDRLSYKTMKDALSKQLKRTGLGDLAIFGGIDIDFRTGNENGVSSYWQPHFHLIAAGEGSDNIHKIKSFHKENEGNPVRVPVKSKPVENLIKAASYTVKGTNWERAGYIAKNGRRNRRCIPLKPKQTRELLIFLDALPMTHLLFMMGMRRRGTELALTKPIVGEKPPLEG